MPSRISTRFLSGSLGAIAVASAVTLAAPAYADGDRGCGQPAVEAVYKPVTHEAVYRTVPAESHDEWRWERIVDTYEYQYAAVLTPARIETDWTRTLTDPEEYRYQRTVIDRAAIPATPATPEVGHTETVIVTPAVVETQYKFVHSNNGNVHWGPADWGNDKGKGPWVRTEETRTEVITPAVTENRWVVDVPAQPGTPGTPEISHTESLWSATDPGGAWVRTTESRPGASSTENETTAGDAPEGAGWTLVATRITDAVIDTLWAAEAPQGYSPTGGSRIASRTHYVTDGTSRTAPAGQGWAEVPNSKVTIVDSPETTELVTAGWIEQVLITPALPATEECVVPPNGDDTPGTPANNPGTPSNNPGTEIVAPPVGQVEAPADVPDGEQTEVPAVESTEEQAVTTESSEPAGAADAQEETAAVQDTIGANGAQLFGPSPAEDARPATANSGGVPTWAWLASIGAGAVLAGAGALRRRRSSLDG